MKITSIEIHPQQSSDFIELSFRDPKNLLPYNAQSITGLDATTSGSRTIAIKVGLNPIFRDYGGLRDTLYKAIASSRTGLVQLIFKNDSTAVAGTWGYISKVEAAQFDKSPGATITVQCDDPIIRGLQRVSIPTSGVDLSTIDIDDELSTAPHGFILALGFTAGETDLEIMSPADPSWSLIVSPTTPFVAGDELYLSTEAGNKYIYMSRSGVITQLVDVVSPNSVWPQLYPGHNELNFSGGASLRLDYLEYYPSYWGI